MRQNGYFTHIWGFKQQMREDPALYEDFCRRCAARLRATSPMRRRGLRRCRCFLVFFATQ
ncbi:MAG: hypothetical protein ACLR4Z_03715 [Butyricicoccaceae bacterium]